MYEEQRNGIYHFALLMHIVNIQGAKTFDLDISRELRELRIQLGLSLAPIKSVLPIRDEPLNICEGYTVVDTPGGILVLIREHCKSKLLVQYIKLLV